MLFSAASLAQMMPQCQKLRLWGLKHLGSREVGFIALAVLREAGHVESSLGDINVVPNNMGLNDCVD